MDRESTARGQFHQVTIHTDHVIAVARTASAAARLPERMRKLNAVNHLLPAGHSPRVLDATPERIVMSRIPGQPIASLVSGNRVFEGAIARDLSSFLDDMRKVDLSRARELGVEEPNPDQWASFADSVREALFPRMNRSGRDRATRELTDVCSLRQPANSLVHGDFGGENLLFEYVDGVPILRGVVDWDSVHIGDQATDLASLAATFDRRIIERIVSQLGFDRSILHRVSAIRATFALQQALAGYQDSDEAEMLDGLASYI